MKSHSASILRLSPASHTNCMSWGVTSALGVTRRVSRQMSSGRGVSGHLPSGCSACLQTQNVKTNIFQTTHATAFAFQTRSVRAFAFWTERVSYRCRVSRQMSSRRGVAGHLPSEHSARLTDTKCQDKFLPDAECQGKYRTDDARHGICLPDEDCQGIFSGCRVSRQMSSGQCVDGICLLDKECLRHPDAAHLTDTECQGKWDPDEAYDGAPHIGNRVVMVVASKRDRQGTVHCSEDY